MNARRLVLGFVILFAGCAGKQGIPQGSLKPHSLLAKGRLALANGDTKKAEKEISALIKEKPNAEEAAEAHYLLGEAYRKSKQNDKAKKAYSDVYTKFKNDPYSALALRKDALILKGEGKYVKAIERLKEAVDEYPVQFNFESCTYAIGHIYKNDLNDDDNAALYFKKLLEKSPKNIHYEVQAINYLAGIYYSKKEYKSALIYYQDLADRFGWSKEARNAVDRLDEIEESLSK